MLINISSERVLQWLCNYPCRETCKLKVFHALQEAFITFQDQGFDNILFPCFYLAQIASESCQPLPPFSLRAVQIHLGAVLMHLAKSGKLFPLAEAYLGVGRTCLVITWAGWQLQSHLYSRDQESMTYHSPCPERHRCRIHSK